MNIFNRHKKPLAHKLVILFLAVMMVIPINYFYAPRVEAGAGAVGGGTIIAGDISTTGIKTAVESTLTTANTLATSISTGSLAAKELFSDGIGYMAAKIFLRAMVRSIINWINSGFEGAPAFVTDLQGFMLSVADEVVGEYIYNSDALNFLCSPFQLDIKIALAIQYSANRLGNYQPQCTLTDVVNNIEGFLDGTFEDGGWPGYLELNISEESNPTHAYLNAQTEMYARITNAQGEELTKLDFGNGFFSMEICDVADKASGAKPNCVIGTPGSVIADSINEALTDGKRELIAADEINEIFNALFSQLAQQVFYGAYGLLGLGGNSTYTEHSFGADGTGSYLDAVAEEDEKMTIDASYISASIDQTVATEKDYLKFQNKIANRIAAARETYNTAKENLDERGCSIGFNFPTGLKDARSTANSEIKITTTLISLLRAVQDGMTNATNVYTQQEAFAQYEELQGSNSLHTQTDVSQAELFVEYDLKVALDQFEANLNDAVNNCSL